MQKIRIREYVIEGVKRPAVPAVSLGQQTIREAQEVEVRDARGEKFTQHIPGESRCRWLAAPGTADAMGPDYVEIADVDDAIAAVLVDDRGWCERVPGRPKKTEPAA